MISDADKERWEARRAAVYQHYQQSCSLRATGREFGISAERVRQIVGQVGGTTNPRGRSKKAEGPRNGQDLTGGSDSTPTAGAEQRG